MKTVTIQIENSDDKLSQAEWSDFAKKCDAKIGEILSIGKGQCRFAGMSFGDAPWQNAVFVIKISSMSLNRLKVELTDLKVQFRQDSIAITEGVTQFI